MKKEPRTKVSSSLAILLKGNPDPDTQPLLSQGQERVVTKLLPRGRPALGTLTAGRGTRQGPETVGTSWQEQPTRNRSPVDAPNSLITEFKFP